MLARGYHASKYLFPHFNNKENYMEMINSRLQVIFQALTEEELGQCDISRESLNDITSHGVRAAAIIHSNSTKGISPHWTKLGAGINKEKVATISSYDCSNADFSNE